MEEPPGPNSGAQHERMGGPEQTGDVMEHVGKNTHDDCGTNGPQTTYKYTTETNGRGNHKRLDWTRIKK
jgi:hypothetical protein